MGKAKICTSAAPKTHAAIWTLFESLRYIATSSQGFNVQNLIWISSAVTALRMRAKRVCLFVLFIDPTHSTMQQYNKRTVVNWSEYEKAIRLEHVNNAITDCNYHRGRTVRPQSTDHLSIYLQIHNSIASRRLVTYWHISHSFHFISACFDWIVIVVQSWESTVYESSSKLTAVARCRPARPRPGPQQSSKEESWCGRRSTAVHISAAVSSAISTASRAARSTSFTYSIACVQDVHNVQSMCSRRLDPWSLVPRSSLSSKPTSSVCQV